MSVLVPDVAWVEDPARARPCPVCSALVENRVLHRAWHLAMVELADQYVAPPRYGSR